MCCSYLLTNLWRKTCLKIYTVFIYMYVSVGMHACLNVYGCTCVHRHICMCVYIWRPEVDIRFTPLLLSIFMYWGCSSPLNPALAVSTSLADLLAPGIPVLGLQMNCPPPNINVGARDLNSSPHTCMAITLPPLSSRLYSPQAIFEKSCMVTQNRVLESLQEYTNIQHQGRESPNIWHPIKAYTLTSPQAHHGHR